MKHCKKLFSVSAMPKIMTLLYVSLLGVGKIVPFSSVDLISCPHCGPGCASGQLYTALYEARLVSGADWAAGEETSVPDLASAAECGALCSLGPCSMWSHRAGLCSIVNRVL